MKKSVSIRLVMLVIGLTSLSFSGLLPVSVADPLVPGITYDSVRTDLSRAARKGSTLYKGPIIDSHVHLDPLTSGKERNSELQEIVDTIGNSGVKYAVFMPTPNEGMSQFHEIGSQEKISLQQRSHSRVKLFCGSNYITVWLSRAYHHGFNPEELNPVLEHLSADIDIP